MTEQALGSTYTLTEQLGSGAMGTVYRGHDKEGRALAFKVLRPDFAKDPALVQRFVQERSAMTQVEHQNVVRMHDLVVEGQTLAIVMDLVEGGDLRATLEAEGTLSPPEAAGLTSSIAAGLAAVHAAGIVHRDVKPENVLLDRSGTVTVPRVTDFGIARLADASASTRSTMALGTPNYVAPEIAEGRPATGAADVYSLGILLYELCTGVTPFEGDSPFAVIRRHAEATAPRPEGVPDSLWAAIRDMLAKDPAERPTTAQIAPYLGNLAVSLEGQPAAARLTEPLPLGEPTTVLPPPSPGGSEALHPLPSEPPRRRRRGALVAGVLVGVLALGGGGYAAWQALLADDGDGSAAEVDDGQEVAAGDAAAASEPTPADPTTEEAPTADASSQTTGDEPTTEASAEPTTDEPTTEEPTEEPTTEEPEVMPDFVGTTLSAARVDLPGVDIEIEDVLNDEAMDSEILEQSVAAGEPWPEAVTLSVARNPVTIYMDSLSSVSNDNLQSATAELDGASFPRSIVATTSVYDTSGYREWNLSRGYRQLVATVGRSDDATPADEQVQVEVFLDQRKVWSERVVLGDPIEMKIDVTDALRLRIEYTSLNDDRAYIVLGDIHLLGLPGEVPEPEDD